MNQRELEPFEAPKILGDIFEAVMGAIYEDGGMSAVHTVFKQMLSPFILFVARYSKEVYKEPKEQMIIECGRHYKMRPYFEVSNEPHPDSVTILEPESGKSITTQALMFTTKILFKNGKTMVSGKGNSKRQSERNAGVEGLKYLEAHPELRFDESI